MALEKNPKYKAKTIKPPVFITAIQMKTIEAAIIVNGISMWRGPNLSAKKFGTNFPRIPAALRIGNGKVAKFPSVMFSWIANFLDVKTRYVNSHKSEKNPGSEQCKGRFLESSYVEQKTPFWRSDPDS